MPDQAEVAASTNAAPSAPLPPPAPAFPIVGIGASAGGLEAAIKLFGSIPDDVGMAFVLVQHLDPDHTSQLTALLARATTLPVHEATDGLPVAPNQIYIIPPQADLTIAHGILYLQQRAERPALHLPIDTFLQALAADQHERAVGVILSGTGSDGTQGLRAIKAAGGLTVAQDPTSAKYDGMPQSAISAGVVDLVLPPEAMVREIARLSQNPALAHAPVVVAGDALPASDNHLNAIFSLLRSSSGVDFSSYKPATITRRITRRMRLHKIEQLANYVHYLRTMPAERDALFQDLLIDVTGFFRDPDVFAALKEIVFPRIAQSTTPELPMRVWVPGCASGEEAYSIAICLMEFFDERPSTPPFLVFATDINEAALVKARAGVYPDRIAQDVSAERLQRFFTRTAEGYRVSKPIRDLCVFARQDVTRDPPFSHLDLLSCRNLLIYLNVALHKRLVALFHFALKPDGFLVLGTSETIGAANDLFSLADRKHKIYARKSTPVRIPPDIAAAAPAAGFADGLRRAGGSPGGEIDLQREIDRVLLARYVPPAVVVNDALQIVQFRGSTGAYLDPLPGVASLDLLRMVHPDLLIDLRTAISTARKGNVTVRTAGIQHRVQDQRWTTNIEVTPLPHALSGGRYFIVVFTDATVPAPAAPAADSPAAAGRLESEQAQIHALQQELTITREHLRSLIAEQETTTEELRAANEEIQSSNEELQSTNEELETAKEELQSTNEEITTVNDELHNRNLELSQINDDLINMLAVINIPIVMVGNDLRIRRFTPLAEQVLSLLPSDIGRPLSDLRPKIDVPDLDRLIAAVIATLTPCEREVQDQDRRWYALRIRPYHTLEHRIEGAVVVLVDVTDLKRAAEAQAARDYAEAIVETIRDPLIVLDQDLRVQTANRAFYTMFQVTPAETEQQFIFAIGNGQWDIAALRQQLTATLRSERVVRDFVVEQTFPQLGPRTMRLNARKIVRNDALQLLLLTIEDITTPPVASV